jgi:protein-S-isoprenylcysteine O-methyltransferase Ste14
VSGRGPEESSLLGPALGTLVFVVLVPGTVIGYVPYLLTRWEMGDPLLGLALTRWLGAALLVPAAWVFADFLLRFVREGRGTPAPVAPPKQLVVTGVFRYVRNPGYVGGIGLIVGQALLFGSGWTLLYAAGVWLMFHLFVVVYEEPTLRSQFGESYERYRREVPRWVPKIRRRARGSSDRGRAAKA